LNTAVIAGRLTARSSLTIYHFGFVERTGKYVRYTYRSERDFASEFDDSPCVAVKPAPESGSVDRSLDSAEHMIEYAHVLRAEQDAKPKQERVHIGGELILTMMLESGTIASTKVHRCADYSDMWEAMNALMASWDASFLRRPRPTLLGSLTSNAESDDPQILVARNPADEPLRPEASTAPGDWRDVRRNAPGFSLRQSAQGRCRRRRLSLS
jgi:hypothetical protein